MGRPVKATILFIIKNAIINMLDIVCSNRPSKFKYNSIDTMLSRHIPETNTPYNFFRKYALSLLFFR